MTQNSKITELLSQWPSRRVLAEELGLPMPTVQQWAYYGRVPASWQLPVVRAAQARGLTHVTAEWMLEQHAITKANKGAA